MSTTRSARSKKPLPSRRLLTLAPFLVVAAGATAAGVVGGLMRAPEHHVVSSAHVGSVDINAQTQEAARNALQQFAEEQKSLRIQVRFAPETGIQRTWKLTAEHLGLGIDVNATLDDAIKSGHDNVLTEVSHIAPLQRTLPVAPHPSVDMDRLRRVLKRIAWNINRKPRKARLIIQHGAGFQYRPEKPGFALDIEGSLASITQAWNTYNANQASGNATTVAATAETPPPDSHKDRSDGSATRQTEPSASSGQLKVALETTLIGKTVQPSVTVNDLKQIDGMLGSFSTHFVGSSSRGSNIALAADHINGTVLAPGEVFSYNQTVGPRVASMGFKNAPVIIHGELVPGIGGGICQVSSTLYNAVLLSNLAVVTRSHHAFPVHYLHAGRDATVVDGAIDFQFRNNTEAPIYIAGGAPYGRLSFSIWGKTHPGRKVSIQLADYSSEPAGIETQSDPTLPAGRRIVKSSGHIGQRITVYRVVHENGQVHRELISRDHYHPFPTIVLVGTRTFRRPTPRPKPVLPVTSPQTQPTATPDNNTPPAGSAPGNQ